MGIIFSVGIRELRINSAMHSGTELYVLGNFLWISLGQYGLSGQITFKPTLYSKCAKMNLTQTDSVTERLTGLVKIYMYIYLYIYIYIYIHNR